MVGVPVDGDGVRTDALDALGAAAIVVTPAHQFPTGVVMAPERRADLVAWANRADRLIIEDDYDAEFRYDRNAIGAIQGLDPCRVIHIGTASKTLAPGIRLGWMSLPDTLIDEVRAAKAAQDSGSPSIEQLALAALIESGDYDRHVARARHVYRQRRDALIAALGRHLPGAPDPGRRGGPACPAPIARFRGRRRDRGRGGGTRDRGQPALADVTLGRRRSAVSCWATAG